MANDVYPALESTCRAYGIPTIQWVETIDSTNAEVARWIQKSYPHGAALLADQQTAGRGRLGRTWLGSSGQNLYLSILLRPKIPVVRLPWLTLAMAVAAAEILGDPIRIKWPNDLLVSDGRKLGGILAEVDLVGGQIRGVVIGVGLNLHAAPPLSTAACLAEFHNPPERGQLAALLIARLLEWVECLAISSDPLRKRWRELADTLGKEVCIGEIVGLASDIDEYGALVVIDHQGRQQRVLAGDVQMMSRIS